MSRMTPNEMALTIGNGLLSFPVTPFDASNKFDAARYRSNLDWLCSYEVAGLFAAGGTGEFFSLTPAEVVDVVTTAVQETAVLDYRRQVSYASSGWHLRPASRARAALG